LLCEGATPGGWSKARTRQIERDGRWRIKRGSKQTPPEDAQRQALGESAVPVFGYKNNLGIDRAPGSIPRFAVTHAPAMMPANSARCLRRTTL
jgi:hypothetical protein